ncbi:HlyD family type I secretion periplasmic adaptor subunit [Stakelama marina]|uniref:Membrane fusion protein (MFP) family protein n=1 Tax=Stakelama marina TaxID=2826939 RepID=A0A8T4IFH0_9SPHN|nr:HlyD family type I secretion periplasmic adaptor subunit [Stakelama marina]MBR0551006.1 HlyD family type I secretion periplasmic adaptor subunit [Stakelama marina]
MNDMQWAQPEIEKSASSPVHGDGLRREIKIGGAIAGAFFIGILGWAAVTPLDAGAHAAGVVAVSGSRQAVQHREGGIITRLDVAEGDFVEKGDPLLEVSASDVLADERAMTSEVIALLTQRARLVAERDRRMRVSEPAEFAALTGPDKALAEEALTGQRRVFEARRKALRTQREVLGQRINQYDQQIGGYSYQMTSNREQQRLMGEELDGLRTLLPKGFVAVNRVRALERGAAQLDGQYGAFQSEIARVREAIGEARLQITALDKQMMQEVTEQLREVEVRLDEVQPRLKAVREKLARSTVRAPATGRVVGLRVFTVGGVIGAGEKLMEIVPRDRNLVIEAKASPSDADDLMQGMETQIRFSGLHERNLPMLKGRIGKVSADSMEDERTGTPYFAIEVIVPPDQVSILRQIRGGNVLKAGLPAEVMVPLRKRTALSYLLEPITQTLWLAGRES